MIGNFERITSHVLHYDPVTKRKTTVDKRYHASMSESNSEVSSLLDPSKPSIGMPRVQFRHDERDEFHKLLEDQK